MGTKMTQIIFAKIIMIELKLITWTYCGAGIQFPLKTNAMDAAAGLRLAHQQPKKCKNDYMWKMQEAPTPHMLLAGQ
eukprot:10397001-Karenia_brevis.AAC.1